MPAPQLGITTFNHTLFDVSWCWHLPIVHPMVPAMRSVLFVFLFSALSVCAESLPFSTVFKGESRFQEMLARAERWKTLPLGTRTATIGQALIGTPYKNYTLEIDDRIEAASVNLNAMDCWTFFEIALAFSRMLEEPKEQWTPKTMLKYIELDRYRHGKCTGSYLSRLHYLEEWALDNEDRGLVRDLTRSLGGVRVGHSAVEMQRNWKSYRYMAKNPDLRAGITRMEAEISRTPMYHIPKSAVAGIEKSIQTGDVICITSQDGRLVGTSHVGLAVRTSDGVLHFMHASHPRNHGKVVLDTRLSAYLKRFSSIAGIMVVRPVK